MRKPIRQIFSLFPAVVAALPSRMLRAHAMIANKCNKFELLLTAFVVFFAAILLSNYDTHARKIFFFAVLPIAAFVGWRFMHQVVKKSIVFWAVAAYLVALGLASLALPGAGSNEIGRHFRLIPLILSFLIIVAFLSSNPRNLRLLMLLSCAIVAISAGINMVGYLLRWELPQPFTGIYERFVSALGMPHYYNSTNISAPYAIFGVAAVASLTNFSISRTEQLVFALSALVLLVAGIYTQSRSAYVGALVGLIVVAGAASRRARVILIICTTIALVAVTVSPLFRGFGTSDRFEVWASYLSMAFDHPLLGVGIRSDIVRTLSSGFTVDQPHNIVLSAFVRGGIVGAAAMLTALIGGLYWSWRYCLSTSQVVPLSLLTTMSCTAMFDYQLLATYPNWPWVTFWFPIGAALGAEIAMRAGVQQLVPCKIE